MAQDIETIEKNRPSDTLYYFITKYWSMIIVVGILFVNAIDARNSISASNNDIQDLKTAIVELKKTNENLLVDMGIVKTSVLFIKDRIK